MDRSVILSNGHYQLKLPFRQDPPDLPDSLPRAERRLTWLKGKMQKEPIFHNRMLKIGPNSLRKCLIEDLLESDEGEKREKVTVGAATVHTDFWDTLFQRYSTWNRVRRVVAWLIRALHTPVQSQCQDEVDGNLGKRLKCTPECLSVLI